ncbi:helix-turn-helix domain-containing protein [Nocardioides panacihumi]|uniref:Helix-turn-helix domain-containing protein n=1 Tax=Nocardioides panacihumi TaxID=400774 RepID=A0ABN2QNI7_9ACTN
MVSSDRDGLGSERSKERWLAAGEVGTSEGLGAVSSDLIRSWERSRAAVGLPTNVHDVPYVAEDVLDAHVLDMFQAPLTRFADELDGTGLGMLLADAQGRILQRWATDGTAARHLDSVGTNRGAVLAEDLVGTNGVGTVAATGRSVQIVGTEHYADLYRNAVCTGTPIVHPMTGKLVAVLTLSCGITDSVALVRPLVKSIAGQLERHVLDAQQPEARMMLAAFLSAARTEPGPVVGFGPQGLVMQSQKAARLTSADVSSLAEFCGGVRRDGRYFLELSHGTSELRVTTLDDGAGAIVSLQRERSAPAAALGPTRAQLVGRAPDWLAVLQTVARHRESRKPLVIAGEPGTGKASVALGLPFKPNSAPAKALTVDAAERHLSGSRKWLQRLADRLDAASPVIVRGLETLDASTLDGLSSLVETHGGSAPVMFTVSASTTEEAAEVAGRLNLPQVWVPSLRERSGDVGALWRFFTDQICPGAGLELRAETLAILEGHDWRRNLKELRGIIEDLTLVGKRGPVLPPDLPAQLQGARQLTMIERAELEAIRRALKEADGNRSRAAEILGLSRATIYRKMKAYRLTA